MVEIVEASVDRVGAERAQPAEDAAGAEGAVLEDVGGGARLIPFRPVIARRRDMVVIAGNQRVWGASELGWKTISTVFVDLDDLREATWRFLDNRGFGEDDEDLAAELLAELRERGADLDLTGFARDETDALLRRLAPPGQGPGSCSALAGGEPDSQLGTSTARERIG